MTNTGRRQHPDRKRAPTVLSAVMGIALANAACAGRSVEMAKPHGTCAEVAAGRAAAPGDDTEAAQAFTAIGQAALYGDIEAVERRLGEGADVDAVLATGVTPLMWSFRPLILPPAKCGPGPDAVQASRARKTGKLRIARLLLDRGADTALADCHGMTALHYLVLMYAEERALVETLQAFLAKGADPDAPDGDGRTPLMFAAQRDRLQLVKALLSAGADPKAAAKDGHTALSIARKRGHTAVAELLERKLR